MFLILIWNLFWNLDRKMDFFIRKCEFVVRMLATFKLPNWFIKLQPYQYQAKLVLHPSHPWIIIGYVHFNRLNPTTTTFVPLYWERLFWETQYEATQGKQTELFSRSSWPEHSGHRVKKNRKILGRFGSRHFFLNESVFFGVAIRNDWSFFLIA